MTTATRHPVYEKGCRIGKLTERPSEGFSDTPQGKKAEHSGGTTAAPAVAPLA